MQRKLIRITISYFLPLDVSTGIDQRKHITVNSFIINHLEQIQKV